MINPQIPAEGAVVFWHSSESTDRAMLKDGLDKESLGKFAPEMRPYTQCLKEALIDTFGGPTMLVRPLEVEGFCVLAEHRGDAQSASHMQPLFNVTIHEDGKLKAKVHDAEGNDLLRQKLDLLRSAYIHAQNVASGPQVTAMLVKILEHLSGVRLRPSGSVYWLPSKELGRWTSIGQIVEHASIPTLGRSCVYTLRTMLDVDTVRAVHDGLVTEIATICTEIDKELDDGKLGMRALDRRIATAKELRAKCSSYEAILNKNLAAVTEMVDKIEQASVSAALVVAAKKMEGQA